MCYVGEGLSQPLTTGRGVTKILVVEDNEQLGQMLVERIERRGHQVLLAVDGDAALASARASQPEVILLEAQLRGGEEWSMARALKDDDFTRAIPIIGLVSNNSDEARDEALHGGCFEVHCKPIDFSKLLLQIDEAAPEGVPAPAATP
jgi:CheY-like chemotaxis protein